MNFKNILLSCVLIFGSMSLSGCYTQLSMFHPDEKMEEFYETYSRAVPRPNLSVYARDGAGTSLSMAYQMMYSRFHRYYGNRYSYWNPYYYGGYYRDYNTYNLAGYTMYIPMTQGERKPRTFSTDRSKESFGTNLNVTRTRNSNTSESNNNHGYSNSSNVSSTRGTSSSSSNNSGGRRVTKRN